MKYKGYEASVEYSEEDRVLHGRILNINDVVSFEGESIHELERAFHDSLDTYLDYCTECGKQPEKPFSGKVQLRLGANLHAATALAAGRKGKSLNEWINDAIRRSLAGSPSEHEDGNVGRRKTGSPLLNRKNGRGIPSR